MCGLLTSFLLHVLAGEKEEALARLRSGVDSGWRYLALIVLDGTTSLDSLRDNPEYIAIATDGKADLVRKFESIRE